jgi:hypothetical protein
MFYSLINTINKVNEQINKSKKQKMGQNKPGFYMKEDLKNVTKSMGDRPAFREGDGFFSTLKKVGRTGTRLLGDVGVQVLDMFQPDHGSDDGGRRPPGATSYGDKLEQKHFENTHYDKSRKLVKEGKTYFTLANYLDDDGEGNARKGFNPSKSGK